MKYYPAQMDKHKFRRMMQNATGCDDQRLKDMTENLEKQQQDAQMYSSMQTTGRSLSYNLMCQKERQVRMMQNYERWMGLWQQDLPHYEKARARMNDGGYTINSKYNIE